MKRLLIIISLGLLLSGNAYAEKTSFGFSINVPTQYKLYKNISVDFSALDAVVFGPELRQLLQKKKKKKIDVLFHSKYNPQFNNIRIIANKNNFGTLNEFGDFNKEDNKEDIENFCKFISENLSKAYQKKVMLYEGSISSDLKLKSFKIINDGFFKKTKTINYWFAHNTYGIMILALNCQKRKCKKMQKDLIDVANSIGEVTDNSNSNTKIAKKYSVKGERPLALSWDGYSDLIAGKVKFNEADYKGSVNFVLPNNDGTCEGSYSLQKQGKGTWQFSCTNNMGAAGTMNWVKNGSVTGTGRDYKGKKVKFTISQ